MDLIWRGLVEALQLIVSLDEQLIDLTMRSLMVSGFATLLATLAGVPLGVALAVGRFPGRGALRIAINTGMGLPPVLVGLTVTLLLWRTGPFGALGLIYTPAAMVIAQFVVALPLAAGITRGGIELLDSDLRDALLVDGAGRVVSGAELVRAALPQVLVAVIAAFGRAISEVGASLIVGGNIAGQTRILTTAITLETGRGDFARAIALGLILLMIFLILNIGVAWQAQRYAAR
jgi:tungstate transport system permease protein